MIKHFNVLLYFRILETMVEKCRKEGLMQNSMKNFGNGFG